MRAIFFSRRQPFKAGNQAFLLDHSSFKIVGDADVERS